jgi:hypothetical protein
MSGVPDKRISSIDEYIDKLRQRQLRGAVGNLDTLLCLLVYAVRPSERRCWSGLLEPRERLMRVVSCHSM